MATREIAHRTSHDNLLTKGMNVVVRTVTYHYIGRLRRVPNVPPLEIRDQFIELDEASWLADSGQWSKFLVDGTPSELEPHPDSPTCVAIGAIVDIVPWEHKLPRSVRTS